MGFFLLEAFLSFKRIRKILARRYLRTSLHFYLFTTALVFSVSKINKSPEAAKPRLRRCRQLPQPPLCQRCAARPAATQGTQPLPGPQEEGKAEGLPNRHLPEGRLPAWPDPALTGRRCCHLSAASWCPLPPLSERRATALLTGERLQYVSWMLKGVDQPLATLEEIHIAPQEVVHKASSAPRD